MQRNWPEWITLSALQVDCIAVRLLLADAPLKWRFIWLTTRYPLVNSLPFNQTDAVSFLSLAWSFSCYFSLSLFLSFSLSLSLFHQRQTVATLLLLYVLLSKSSTGMQVTKWSSLWHSVRAKSTIVMALLIKVIGCKCNWNTAIEPIDSAMAHSRDQVIWYKQMHFNPCVLFHWQFR